MDSIDIEIQASSGKGIEGLQQLIDTLKVVNQTLNNTQNLTKKFDTTMKKIKKNFKSLEKIKIPKAPQVPNGDNKNKDKKLSNIEKLNKRLATLNGLTSLTTGRIKSMFNTIGKSRVAKVGLRALDLGFGNISNKISEASKRVRGLIKDFSKYALALYGIRSAFYAVRNVSNEFLSSQDAVAKQLKVNIDYLKFSLGSLLAPVIDYLTNAMYKLLQIIQYIVYYFAKINIFAGRSAKNYAAMGASAGKAAKEAQKQLQAFDELNNINLEKNSGSGGGAGDLTPGFDLSEVQDLKPLFDDIENWAKKLADKINNALYSIKWDLILEGAEKLANGLAKFLNDFTYYLNWEELGYSISQGFNTALIFADTFFQKYDWSFLGKSIATGFNTALDTIQWDVLGRKLTDGIRATILTLEGFVTTFNWIEFGKKVAEALSSAFFNIPWSDLGNTLNVGIQGIFDSINTFLDTMPWSEIGETIGKFLNDINWSEIFKKLFIAVGKIAAGLTDLLWSAIFSGSNTKIIIASLVASFVALKASIKGLFIVTELVVKFKALVEVAGGIDKLKATVVGFSKAFAGITLFITGSVMAVKNFVDAWQNGLNLVNGAFIVLGVTLSSIGLLILGVSAPIVAIVAAVTLATGAIALLTKAFVSNKAAIKDSEQAQKDYDAALQESKQAEDDYKNAIARANDTFERLQEVQEETKLSGEELFNKVQEGTLIYAELTAEQKRVYKAYKDNKEAQDEVQAATEKMKEAKKEEIKQSFEHQLALAKESKNYDDFKKSVVEAFESEKISADEARDLIERSMAGMSDASEKTFMEDLPGDIKEGLDPDRYSSIAEKFKEGFTAWWDNLKNVVSDWWTEYVEPWFTWQKWFELGINAFFSIRSALRELQNFHPIRDWWTENVEPYFTWQKWLELALKGVEGIQKAFSNLNIKIKMPHFSWTTQPIGGTVGKILSALNLPASLPKLNVSWYADGGYPDVGELFVANEAGPEMIGKIGNKTTVANNDQITKSIAQAAYEAMNKALNENDNNGQPLNIYFGNERLYSGYTKHKSQASNQYGISI